MPRPARPASRSVRRLAACVLGLGVAVLAALLVTPSEDEGSGTGTSAPAASLRGDVGRLRIPRPRAARPCDDADLAVESEETEPTPSLDDAPPLPEVAPDDAPAPTPLPEPFVLRVVDDRGAPIKGVSVTWGSTCPGRGGTTDRHGEIDFYRSERVTVHTRDGRTSARLEGPLTVVVAGRVPELEVLVVDGATGAALPTARGRDGGPVSREATLRVSEVEFEPLGTSVRLKPPEGFGMRAEVGWRGHVARRARRTRLVVAAFPAETWTFRALDREGRPVAGASADSVELDRESAGESRAVTFRSEISGDDGVFRVSGIPRIPFVAKMDVGIRAEGGGCRGLSLAFDAPPPAEPIDVVLTNGGAYRSPAGHVSGCPATPPPREGPTAPLRVRVLHRDGVPAAGVSVRCDADGETTDSDGRASFSSLPVGDDVVVAAAHGFLPTAVPVAVGRDQEIEILETVSRPVRVIVTDVHGAALPAARVTVSYRGAVGPDGACVGDGYSTIAQLEGDLEHLTPVTGPLGYVDLAVPLGTVQYSVVLGGAYEHVSSDSHEVRVVLGPPETR